MKKMLFLLLVTFAGFAQPIGQYKYVIVPSKFDAQKKPGQFGLNHLTKLFLEKNGYTVFYDTDILPLEVTGESCNKIYANVYGDNTIRKTRLRVEIKDCRNAVLFVSDYGESAEKDNNVAYNQALRAAFKSFDKPEYRHARGAAEQSVANPSAITVKPAVVEAVAPVKATEAISKTPIEDAALLKVEGILNAQPIANGFQLVDTTPKIVLKMFATSQPEIFIGERSGKNGIVFKKQGQWVFEYYENKLLITEPLSIKF